MPITIAQLTDLHLPPIVGFTPRYWNLKRAAGYVNWVRKRRDCYSRDVLDRVVADLHTQAPDHIAVTGDLANIGLPQEHVHALHWLQSLGTPREVSVIPGNHDIYSSIGRDPGVGRWAPYMRSDDAGAAYASRDFAFPFVRVLGRVALVGTNSAVPTPPLIASGRLGAAQLSRLGDVLARLGRDGLFRVVMIHHPPLPGQAGRWRALADASEVRAALARHGAELIIHGHNHRNMLAWCDAASGRVPVVGLPSSTMARVHHDEPLARYNLYRISGPPWMIELVGRGLEQPDGPIVELERRILTSADATSDVPK